MFAGSVLFFFFLTSASGFDDARSEIAAELSDANSSKRPSLEGAVPDETYLTLPSSNVEQQRYQRRVNTLQADVVCSSAANCNSWKEDAWMRTKNACSLTHVVGPKDDLDRQITVYYDAVQNGIGPWITDAFEAALAAELKRIEKQQFSHGFEWCAGPAFIGFSLLAHGLVGSLTLADINPEAVKCLFKTVEKNLHILELHQNVFVYLSKDFAHVHLPGTRYDIVHNGLKRSIHVQPFDVVVSNPPNYLKPPNYGFSVHLRGEDPDWIVHTAFFASVLDYLSVDAKLFIMEVACKEIFVPFRLVLSDDRLTELGDAHPIHKEHFDNREALGASVYDINIKLAAQGGLHFVRTDPCWISEQPDEGMLMVQESGELVRGPKPYFRDGVLELLVFELAGKERGGGTEL